MQKMNDRTVEALEAAVSTPVVLDRLSFLSYGFVFAGGGCFCRPQWRKTDQESTTLRPSCRFSPRKEPETARTMMQV